MESQDTIQYTPQVHMVIKGNLKSCNTSEVVEALQELLILVSIHSRPSCVGSVAGSRHHGAVTAEK